MHLIDWSIIAALLTVLFVGAAKTRQHATTVAGFLAAERCGGRYLIAVSDNIARLGVITLIYYFEVHYQVGFTAIWWILMEEPVLIAMALSGWVVYRFRQTRALTLAEFFEKRYSRNFRIFAGLVAFLAGMINFGIFPSVGARFFIRLWDLPPSFDLLGLSVQTFPSMMFLLLFVPLVLLLVGGQIAVMVTDFLQGVVANVAFIVIIAFLLLSFSWDQIATTLMNTRPEHSLVDPFDIGGESSFNITYFLISAFTVFYTQRAWQGTQGYNSSAINAHEAKMSFILGQWRFRVLMLITVVLPICMKTFLTHPDYAAAASAANTELTTISSEVMQNQLRAPIVMREILPVGLIGLASVAMLGAFISTHDTYMHSWAAILIQDVLLPFRKRKLSERAHLRLLRWGVVAIAVFIFLFSLLFQHTQYIALYCAASSSVFVGGAGIAIIGGLYWSRGTTTAAWAAMITGMVLALSGILIEKTDPAVFTDAFLADGAFNAILLNGSLMLHHLTGQELSFLAMMSASLVYVLVSLTNRSTIDLDKLLHRGKYAIAGESSLSIRDARGFWERLGFSREFTGTDRVVTYITLGWPLAWTVAFIVVTTYALAKGIEAESWLNFWRIWMYGILATGAAVTIWLSVGGFIDLRKMFRMLNNREPHPLDDGQHFEQVK